MRDLLTALTEEKVGLPPSRIDVLTQISGVDYDEARRDAVETTVSDIRFRVPARAVLLRNKRASGRAKDLEDVRRLEALEGKGE